MKIDYNNDRHELNAKCKHGDRKLKGLAAFNAQNQLLHRQIVRGRPLNDEDVKEIVLDR